jgi:hypothetical protein
MNALAKYLDKEQKDALAQAYASFEVKTTGPIVFPLQTGIKGLLFELNKGANGGYVSPAYLREKLSQVIEAVEDGEAEEVSEFSSVTLVSTELQEAEADGQPILQEELE